MSFPSLYFSRAIRLPRSRGCTSAQQDACTYTHTNLSSLLFRNLPTYISNLALSLPLLSFEHFPFFVPPVNFLAFFLSVSRFLLPRSHPLTKSVERNCAGGERERRKKAGGVKLPPSSEKRAHQHHHHYHHHYHRSQSLLRSRASIIGELAIYAWSIPPCLTRLLLRAPSPFSPLSLSCSYCPFPFFLFLRPPPPPLLSLSLISPSKR